MKRHYAILLAVLALAACTRDYTGEAEANASNTERITSPTEIPVGEAVAALNRFLDSTDPVTRGGRRRTIARVDRVSAADMFPATTRSDSKMPEVGDLLYVVNFSNDEGYAVLGADSRLDTILIVGDNGSFDPLLLRSPQDEDVDTGNGYILDSIPSSVHDGDDLGGNLNLDFDPIPVPGLTPEELYCEEEDEYYIGSTSLSGVEGLIGDMLVDYTLRHTIWVGDKEKPDDPTGAVLQVGPLLKTNWGQDYPYNSKFHFAPPSDKDHAGEQRPAGCTTIATCQILTYLKETNLKNTFGITESTWADFENFKDYKQTISSTLKNDLATFTLSVADGIGVKYNYWGSGGTFALPVKVKRYLESLGYDVNRIIGFKYDRTQLKIVESIKNRRPVFIGALDEKTGKNGGHAWVIDGYRCHRESNNFFNHCNFGWNGQSNGWYYYKLFNSDDSGVVLDNEESGTQTFNYTWWFRVLIIQ